MIKTIPLLRMILILICCLLIVQNVFPKYSSFIVRSGAGVKHSGFQKEESYKQEILKAKLFAGYLEEKWGEPIRKLEKYIYMPFPYDQTMRDPAYGCVKNSYPADHWRFMEEPERYGIVAFVQKDISSLPYNELVYKYLKNSNSFIEHSPPLYLNDFILFLH